MATNTTYEFKQPIGGRIITWRPLKTGQELQIKATYRDAANVHLQNYARLAVRIVAIDGQPAPNNGPVQTFQDWEDYDTDAFAEAVAVEESKRAAALQKPTGTVAADITAQIERTLAALAETAASLRALNAQAQLLAAGGAAPLPPTS